MDDVYLLNSPFTFQSMEKHAAYCAMMRLGLKVPETVLVPYKNPLDNAKYAYTSARYNSPFDLDQDRRIGRVPALHEAVRRRRVARVCRASATSTNCTGPTTSPARCSCTYRPRSTASTCSRVRCRSAPRRW